MLKEINNMTRLRGEKKKKNNNNNNKETEIIFHLPIVRKYEEVIKVFISVVCITKHKPKSTIVMNIKRKHTLARS